MMETRAKIVTKRTIAAHKRDPLSIWGVHDLYARVGIMVDFTKSAPKAPRFIYGDVGRKDY